MPNGKARSTLQILSNGTYRLIHAHYRPGLAPVVDVFCGATSGHEYYFAEFGIILES